MRQRVMIAIGLACNPKLIIADEPTTALDVTIQAQILELMKDLSRKLNIALIIITHNLGVVARYADRVIVMYAARLVEQGAGRRGVPPAAPSLHDGPAALGAAARPRRAAASSKPSKAWCRISPTRRPAAASRRAARSASRSATQEPPLSPTDTGGVSRCHRHAEIAAGKIAWAGERSAAALATTLRQRTSRCCRSAA